MASQLIGPDMNVHPRVKNISLMVHSYRGGASTVSVDKPGLTPRTPSFTAPANSKTEVILDIGRTNETYTVTFTDPLGSDTCTVTVISQCSTGVTLGTVQSEIKTCIEAIDPTADGDIFFEYQEDIIEAIEQVSNEPRKFNFPLMSADHGELIGSRFGEYSLQVAYPMSVIDSDFDDILEAVHSYQWTAGILAVIADQGSVQYFENLKMAVLTIRIYALYNALDE